MGMDYGGLAPRSEVGEHFHLNWTSHSYMGTLLDQMGADMDEWAGSNDGAVISDETAREWAKLLRKGINFVRECQTSDKSFTSGIRAMPLYGDRDPEEAMTTGYAGMVNRIWTAGGGSATAQKYVVVPLDKETRKFILDFAAFLGQCGGCEQW